MVPYSFDTGKAREKLQDGGFDIQQASTLTDFMVESQQELATKADLDLAIAKLDASFKDLKAEFSELKVEFAELKVEFATVKTELERIEKKFMRLTLILFGATCVFIATLLSIFEFMVP